MIHRVSVVNLKKIKFWHLFLLPVNGLVFVETYLNFLS